MRFANNFNPEWGYLAPAPSFARTVRTVVVAAAIGASAGGAVVFSLVVHPAAEESSVAARTLVQPAAQLQAMTHSSAPQQRVQADARTAIESEPAMLSNAHAGSPRASEFEHKFDSSGSGECCRAGRGSSRNRLRAAGNAQRDGCGGRATPGAKEGRQEAAPQLAWWHAR